MKRKRLLSLVLSGLMLFSMPIYAPVDKIMPDWEITGNAANFNYTEADIFVADSLLGKAVLPDGNNYFNTDPILAYDVSMRDWTFKEIAEGIIDRDWLLGADVFWINMEKALSFEIVGDDNIFSWQQVIYETLLMDYLTYYYESSEYKSKIAESTMKYSVSLYKGLEDTKYIESIEDRVYQNIIRSMSVEDAIEYSQEYNLLDKYEKSNKNTYSALADGITTAADYFDKVNKLKAIKQADEERVAFLQGIKNISDDENLNKAIDDVIEKYEQSLLDSSLGELAELGMKEITQNVWDAVVKEFEIPVLEQVKLGVTGFDLLFNNKGIAEARMQMTILYIIHYQAAETYRSLREKHIANPTSENAMNFINAYQQYVAFVAYASNVTKNYLAQRFVEGYANQLSNWIAPNNDGKVTYDGYSSAMDSCIAQCKALNSFPSTANKLFNSLSGNFEYLHEPEVLVKGITLEQHEVTIDLERYNSYPLGTETLVKMKITPEDATNQAIEFSSSNESIVKVASFSNYPNLYLIPVSVGTATVTITTEDGGYTDSIKVTVVNNGEDSADQPSKPETDTSNFEWYELSDGTIRITKYIGKDKDVVIPRKINGKNVTIIDSETFYGCSSLVSVTIPDSVTSIPYDAFGGCSSLVYVLIPDNVTSIGAFAFIGCSSLTSVTIPDSVTSIDDCAFKMCSSLTSVTIPDSVTSIQYGTFYGCSSLTSVTIPDSVIIIDDSAFEECSSLTSVTIPDSVISIGASAFEECSSLVSVTIPDSVGWIYEYAFAHCSNLTSVTIPDSVTSINSRAFLGCNNLTDVYYSGSEAEWNTIKIGDYNDDLLNATIHFNSTGSTLAGDCNNDNKLTVADVVMLQKHLLGAGGLANWQNADLYEDGVIDVFDLVMMKRKLIYG